MQVWHGAPQISGTEIFARLLYTPARGVEDHPVRLPITAALADLDGSETLALRLSGFPAGAVFSRGAAGTGADAGAWLITDPADIAALATAPLTMTPPANYNGSFTLSVTALVTDYAMLTTGAAANTTSLTRSLQVLVAADNDGPVAVADTGSATENETKSFDVLANDTDVDAGDTKALVGVGKVIVDGVEVTDGRKSAFSVADGKIAFHPGTAYDYLRAGQDATVVVAYTMKDRSEAQSSSTLTLTIYGENDAATSEATGAAALPRTQHRTLRRARSPRPTWTARRTCSCSKAAPPAMGTGQSTPPATGSTR